MDLKAYNIFYTTTNIIELHKVVCPNFDTMP